MADKPEKPRLDCDVFLMVNAEGEYVACEDDDGVSERYDEYCSGNTSIRKYHLTVNVPIPGNVRASVTVPDDVEDHEALQITLQP